MSPSTLSGRLRTLLTAGERYAQTDLHYLIKNASWLTIGQISIALLALLLSITFARFVPKDIYGSYRYLLSVFWTLTTFSLTGIPAALARAIAKGEDGAYKESLRLSLLWSFPMILISLGLSVYYCIQGNTLLFIGTLIIALIGPFMQTSFLFGSILEGKKDFRVTALAGIVLNVVPTVSLILSMFVSQNPLVYLFVYLVANAGTAGLISWYVWQTYREAELRRSESLFSLGAHFSAMNVLAGISQQIDRLLVFHYLGAVELAVYSFAIAVPDQLKAAVSNIATISFPKFANRPFEEIKQTLSFRVGKFTLLMIILTMLYIFLAPWAFHLIFPTYSEAILYSQIYALALIPLGSLFPTTALQAHAANRELYYFNIISSVFQIGILFPAIAWYGLLGAVVSRIFSRAFGLWLSLFLMRGYTIPLPKT